MELGLGLDTRVDHWLYFRWDAPAHLLAGVVALDRDLRDRHEERVQRRVGAREVAVVVLPEATGPRAVEHRAHREQRVRGVTGEDLQGDLLAVEEVNRVGRVRPEVLGEDDQAERGEVGRKSFRCRVKAAW